MPARIEHAAQYMRPLVGGLNVVRAGSSRHHFELDGVRGIAILLILTFHLSGGGPESFLQRIFALGWCGVDLFFVLSGFLITGILLESKKSPGFFRNFFARRLRRIAPLYYCVIVAVFWILIPAARRMGTLRLWTMIPASEQWWFWFPVANIHSALGAFPGEPLGHFWSLAVEEQFYLFWPVILFVFSEVWVMRISAGIVVSSLILRNLPFLLYVQLAYPEFLYRMTPFHMDGLALGAFIATAFGSPRTGRWMSRRFAKAGLLLSFAGTVCLIMFGHQTKIEDRLMVRFGYSAFALTSGFLVLYARLNSGLSNPLAIVLRWPLLRSFGKYSYAIYVLHPLFAHQLRDTFRTWLPHSYWPAASVPSGIILSWCAGWCSWHLIEKHFNGRPVASEVIQRAA